MTRRPKTTGPLPPKPEPEPEAPKPSFQDEVITATTAAEAQLEQADAVIVIALRDNEVVMNAQANINQAAAMLKFANQQIEAAALKARLAELGHPVN